jgi:hypothetical protein
MAAAAAAAAEEDSGDDLSYFEALNFDGTQEQTVAEAGGLIQSSGIILPPLE